MASLKFTRLRFSDAGLEAAVLEAISDDCKEKIWFSPRAYPPPPILLITRAPKKTRTDPGEAPRLAVGKE
jgi:hypothetical protein